MTVEYCTNYFVNFKYIRKFQQTAKKYCLSTSLFMRRYNTHLICKINLKAKELHVYYRSKNRFITFRLLYCVRHLCRIVLLTFYILKIFFCLKTELNIIVMGELEPTKVCGSLRMQMPGRTIRKYTQGERLIKSGG